MNNFVALYFEKSSLDHGDWDEVVGFGEEEMRNELLIQEIYMCFVLGVFGIFRIRYIVLYLYINA